MHTELINTNIPVYKHPIHVPIQELRAEEGGGLILHNGLIIRTTRYQIFCKTEATRYCLLPSYYKGRLWLESNQQRTFGS